VGPEELFAEFNSIGSFFCPAHASPHACVKNSISGDISIYIITSLLLKLTEMAFFFLRRDGENL
jgi:hypothetical protein